MFWLEVPPEITQEIKSRSRGPRSNELLEGRNLAPAFANLRLDIVLVFNEALPKILLPMLVVSQNESPLPGFPLGVANNPTHLLNKIPGIGNPPKNRDKSKSRVIKTFDKLVLVDPELGSFNRRIRHLFHVGLPISCTERFMNAYRSSA